MLEGNDLGCEARHPNIAVYLDILEGPQHFFIVMEELRGAELMEQIEQLFPVTETYLQMVMRQVFEALASPDKLLRV